MGVIPALSDTAPFSSERAGRDYFDSDAHYRALVLEFEKAFQQEKRLIFLTGDPTPGPTSLSRQFMAAMPTLRRPTVIAAERAMSLHGLVARYGELLEAGIGDATAEDHGDLLTEAVIAGLCRTAAATHYAWPRTVLLSGDAAIAGLRDKILSAASAPVVQWHRLRRLATTETD